MSIRKPDNKHRKGIDTSKIVIITLLILLCLWVSNYYHFVLRSDILVTHLFYLPVVFAGFWWGRRSIWIAIALGGYLMGLHSFFATTVPVMDDIQQIIVLVIVSAVVSALRDKSLKTERALRESESKYRDILESITEGLITVDHEYKIIAANKAYCHRIRIPAENVIGQYCYKVSHHIDTPCHEAGEDCAVRHTFETGEPHTVIHTHYDREGSPLYLETKSYPIKNEQGKIISIIETLNDITGKVKLEEELRSAEKMAAVGQLSAGLAHDFNNILAAIVGYASVLRIKLGNDSSLVNNAEKILALTEKASNLIKSLLTFSRTQSVRKAPVRLNEILQSVEQLLPDIMGKNIERKIMPADGDLTLMADAVRLEQVLRILAENARDAMPRGGRFTFSLTRIEPDKTFRETHEFVQTCPYVLISVSDTGSGMDKATMTRIFEPFFTTKEVGKGTGLGLATAYGIIKQHDGYIDVQSEPDKGTTFRIYLPVEDKSC